MKKSIYIIIILLIIFNMMGCREKYNNKIEEKEINNDEEILEDTEDKYVDDNTLKIAFYDGNNGIYKRLDRFESQLKEMEVINTFSIILSNEDEVQGYSIKKIFNKMIEENSNINNYKIGYNLKFNLKDGREINENILRPLNYGNYGFGPYIYAWLYDDIHANGWHSHIEENEYTDDTIMSSIKLMWGSSANEIASDIELSVFTYDSDDFDSNGNYRGNSKFTTIIEKK